MKELQGRGDNPGRPTIREAVVGKLERTAQAFFAATPQTWVAASTEFTQTTDTVLGVGRVVADTRLSPETPVDEATGWLSGRMHVARYMFQQAPLKEAEDSLRMATRDFIDGKIAFSRLTGEPLPEIPDTPAADGEFVKELQQDLWPGETQAQLADRLGIGRTSVSHVVVGDSRLSERILEKTIDALSKEEGQVAEELLVQAELMRQAAQRRARESHQRP